MSDKAFSDTYITVRVDEYEAKDKRIKELEAIVGSRVKITASQSELVVQNLKLKADNERLTVVIVGAINDLYCSQQPKVVRKNLLDALEKEDD